MERAIQLSVRVAAARERVWAAWTDPAHVTGWFPDRMVGEVAVGQTIVYHWDALNMGLELEVVELVEGRRLVLRGQPANLPPQTQAIELSDDGEGTTRVSLSHRGFSPGDTGEDVYHGTAAGWHLGLQVLKRYVERYFGQPRINAWLVGMAPARFEQVFAHFSGEGVAQWLTAGGPLPADTGPFSLALRDGGAMTGEVLARYVPRDVALAWDEVNGVLTLRQFAVAPGVKLVGANLMSWGMTEDALVPLAQSLEAAVDRLIVSLGGASRRA